MQDAGAETAPASSQPVLNFAAHSGPESMMFGSFGNAAPAPQGDGGETASGSAAAPLPAELALTCIAFGSFADLSAADEPESDGVAGRHEEQQLQSDEQQEEAAPLVYQTYGSAVDWSAAFSDDDDEMEKEEEQQEEQQQDRQQCEEQDDAQWQEQQAWTGHPAARLLERRCWGCGPGQAPRSIYNWSSWRQPGPSRLRVSTCSRALGGSDGGSQDS
jgi:hypothetical protein